MKTLLLFLFLSAAVGLPAQSDAYRQRKAEQLAAPSPFQKEIDGAFPERIAYQDDLVVALNSIAPQAPVHLLIIPRKRIPTINDLTESDSSTLARMVWVARRLAAERGIAESGYRLVINTNEDAGQSAFHIHMHLLGGGKTGPMVDQRWRNRGPQPARSYREAIEKVKTAYDEYFAAWLRADSATLLAQMTPDAVLVPPGVPAVSGQAAIREYWFPSDGSRTVVTRFDHSLDELRLDGNMAYVRGTSALSFRYEKGGQQMEKTELRQQRVLVFERQEDERWLITCHVWNGL